MAQFITPVSIPVEEAAVNISKTRDVSCAVEIIELPLRRRGRKSKQATITFSGKNSHLALNDLEDWLEARGVF